jgi:hypothetical protein
MSDARLFRRGSTRSATGNDAVFRAHCNEGRRVASLIDGRAGRPHVQAWELEDDGSALPQEMPRSSSCQISFMLRDAAATVESDGYSRLDYKGTNYCALESTMVRLRAGWLWAGHGAPILSRQRGSARLHTRGHLQVPWPITTKSPRSHRLCLVQ